MLEHLQTSSSRGTNYKLALVRMYGVRVYKRKSSSSFYTDSSAAATGNDAVIDESLPAGCSPRTTTTAEVTLWRKLPWLIFVGKIIMKFLEVLRRLLESEIKICIRAVYYLLNSIARQTSLEIREFTLPGPGPF